MPKLLHWLLPLVAGLGLSACKEAPAPDQTIRPAQVWTVTEPATVTGPVYSGETAARFSADLGFRIGGKITRRTVEVGDHIAAGHTVAQLDPTDLELSVQAAQANLRAAESELATAQAELKRNRELVSKNFVSDTALDTFANRQSAAQASVRAAAAQLALARNQLGYSDLTVDTAGVVTAVYAETGQVVGAAQPVVHIAYDGEREVHIRIGETSAQTLRNGSPVEVRLWSQPEPPLHGRIREISPAADSTRSFLAKIALLSPPADLRLGVTADVRLPVAAGPGVWLPAGALFQQGESAAVWLVGSDDRVRLQRIRVIAFDEHGVSVEGLASGTQVIAAGVHKLSDGQQIQAIAYDGKAGT